MSRSIAPSPLRRRLMVDPPVLLVILLLVIAASTAPSIEAQAPPAPPATVDLRVDGEPLLVLFERIARDLGIGLTAHADVTENLEERVTIDVPEARWEDALSYFVDEFGIAVVRTPTRLELLDRDTHFERGLERRTFSVHHLTERLEQYSATLLGIASVFESGGGSSLLDLGDPQGAVIGELLDIIVVSTGSGAWDREGVDIDFEAGLIHARNTPAVLEQVESVLLDLERRLARQVVCRAYDLPSGEVPATATLTAEQTAALVADRLPVGAWISADEQRNHSEAIQTRTVRETVRFVEHVPAASYPQVSTGRSIEVRPHVTRLGILAELRIQRVDWLGIDTTPIRHDDGSPWIDIEHPRLEYAFDVQSRLIQPGGASVHVFGDRTWVVQLDVVD